jgi:Holliday junction resolvase-like predicted endonuclease
VAAGPLRGSVKTAVQRIFAFGLRGGEYAAQKLRYAAEFFAAAFPSSKSMRCRKDFVVSLEKRQDALQPASFIGNIG